MDGLRSEGAFEEKVARRPAPVGMLFPIRVVVPAIPPSWNDRERCRHWSEWRTIKYQWMDAVKALTRDIPKITAPVEVRLRYRFKDRRRRDLDNFSGKFLLDGLVGTVLPDDDTHWVRRLVIEAEMEPGDPQTVIEVYAYDPSL